jgi:replicative DNA helicase
MNFPHYIQKAVDLGLLQADGDKIIGCNKDAVETAMGAARLIEKLQPTTTAKMDDTTDQEAIVLCRVLSSPSGVARHLWSELRAAVGVGHGQRFPDYFWSTRVFGAIGYYIDKIFLGDADFETISVAAIISMHTDVVSVDSYNQAPLSELSKTASTLGLKETMNAYGAAKSEWNTALDLLRKNRVKSMYKETLHMATQVTRADSKLEKSIEFLQQRSMECLGLLRGSVGQQGNYRDMLDDLYATEGRTGFIDRIWDTNASVKPVSTGILALDIDMEGGVRPDGVGGGRVFTLCGRTGCSKTQTGVQIASAAALGGLTVGFISAELDEGSIYARLWSSITAQTATCQEEIVYSGSIQAPPESKKDKITGYIAMAATRVQASGGKLLVEAPWGADVDAVVSSMRSMKARNPELRLVVLDHFHCLARHKGAPSNEATMLEERAYRLMTAAKELDIDLVVLAQMNRVGMDSLSSKQPPGLDQIRGTDAIAHISHAVWILRKERNDDGNSQQTLTGNLELWHAKTRGRQAYWNEQTSSVEGIRGFIEKSVIRINHPTSSILKGREGDDTYSQIHEKTAF